MKIGKGILTGMIVTLAGAGLVACGGSEDFDSNETGTMSMGITDAAVDDVTEVRLTLSAVEVKPRDGERVRVDYEEEPLVIENLLDLQGSLSTEIMEETEVPAGRYNWIRLHVIGGAPDSRIVTEQGEHFDLFVPGQQQGGEDSQRHMQLVSGFTVPVDGHAHFVIDVDLRRALTRPANADHYLLRPAVRIVDDVEVGTIRGTVEDSLVTADTCTNDLDADKGNAVYLYGGHDASLGDVHVDENGEPVGNENPITVANVRQDPDTGLYEYEVGFVPAGDYTIAFTCQAMDDDESEADEIEFSEGANIGVEAGETTVQDFPVES